jgi:uncharacterized Zn finger protein
MHRPKSLSVADLVPQAAIEVLATPSNLRLGREIAAGGGVEFEELGPLRMRAKVTGGQRRRVELVSDHGKLGWSCSCTKRGDLFCKHCVAAAVAIRENVLRNTGSDHRIRDRSDAARAG